MSGRRTLLLVVAAIGTAISAVWLGASSKVPRTDSVAGIGEPSPDQLRQRFPSRSTTPPESTPPAVSTADVRPGRPIETAAQPSMPDRPAAVAPTGARPIAGDSRTDAGPRPVAGRSELARTRAARGLIRPIVELAPATEPGPNAVEGRVIDVERQPVEGALVRVLGYLDGAIGQAVTTGTDGAFRLPHQGISDGAAKRLRVEHVRYRPREVGFPGRGPRDGPTRVEVVLEEGPAYDGVVLMPNGVQPAAGAAIEIVGRAETVAADEVGRFLLPVLPPGAHVVIARTAGRFAGIARIDVGPDGFALDERPIEIVTGEVATIVASGLETENASWNPPLVEVWLGARRTPQGPLPVAALRPEKGAAAAALRFEGLAPATYTISPEVPAIGYHAPEPLVVTLAPGEVREVWLGRRGTAVLEISATRSGAPPARAVFSAWPTRGGSTIEVTSAGAARLEGLDADEYHVFCNDQENGLGRAVVRLEAGEVRRVHLDLLTGGRLRGGVVDLDGHPAVGARVVSVCAEGGIVREAVADAEGGFVLPFMYPGAHTVRATLDARAASQVLTFAPGEEKGPLFLTLEP